MADEVDFDDEERVTGEEWYYVGRARRITNARFQKMASRVQSAMRALRLAGVGPKSGLRAPGLGRTLPG